MSEKYECEVDRQIERDGHKILYKCIFGSRLYGTHIEGKSDLDIRGLFLPSLKSCILGKAPKSYQFKTGNDSEKNSKDDVDISYWSLQYWLTLLEKGDSNAMDLLFSFKNRECVIYMDNLFKIFLDKRQFLYDSTKVKGYSGYALSQAKRYGIRGSKVGILKNIINYLDNISSEDFKNPTIKLDKYINGIEEKCGQKPYCFTKIMKNGDNALIVNGSCHISNIKMSEFKERIQREWDLYGDRAKLAEKNNGIDWKALSHAVRCIEEIKQLYNTGAISFPINNVDLVKKIKYGEMNWDQVEEIIVDGVEEIERLSQKTISKYNKKLVDKLILSCYNV